MSKLKKQKEFVRSEFGKVMTADNWGHFKHNDYRIKMKKILFRFEINRGFGWSRLASVNYKDANAGNIQNIINHIFKVKK